MIEVIADGAMELLEEWFNGEQLDLGVKWADYNQIMGLCESPVEQMFLAAFPACFHVEAVVHEERHNPGEKWWSYPRIIGSTPWEFGMERFRVIVFPQYPIRPSDHCFFEDTRSFRTDFLFVLTRAEWRTMETNKIHKRLVVEIDGHDFHDRTKKQASADRLRDRMLMQAGFPVVRFTGSDVYRDASDCMGQVELLLEAEASKISDTLGF